jgi:dTDP-4-amino-4,6-dideoxygalactose transaminase
MTLKLRGVPRVMASTIQSTVPFMDLRHVNAGVADLVLADQLVSLPLFPGITEAQMAMVVDGVKEYFRDGV